MKRQWVIIRGLGREAGHNREFLEKLKKADPTAEVKCVDLPGAGAFYKLSSPMSIESIAEFLYLELKKDVVDERYIISVSLGAMVVTALLRSYPDIVKGAVLANSSFANLSPFYHRLQLEAFMHIYRAAMAVNSHERERAVLDMVSNRQDRHNYIDEWVQIAEERPVSTINFLKQLFAAATYSLPQEKPKTPILVLCSGQDRMVRPECSQKLSAYWDLPIEVHPTAGHEIWLDEGEWVIEKTLSFFKIPSGK